jgi:5-methylcytosine-specific restriction enzyme A
MTIPHEHEIQYALMCLLEGQPEGKMHCNDVYRVLAEQYPQLTRAELEDPYENSISHWANRVQFAVMHLKDQGLILHHTVGGGRGIWAISVAGREWLSRIPNADELLKELGSM